MPTIPLESDACKVIYGLRRCNIRSVLTALSEDGDKPSLEHLKNCEQCRSNIALREGVSAEKLDSLITQAMDNARVR